ncbi:baculoviral IAP repeat-containing protein 7-like [Branchiostoma floridae]|uniref:Baculoviral IAP repeat-containing protein 7-like n=1 Tax=Branchiostoma floridae TaxID=7739 RepID=A0A9J7MBS8_BRAFL|nr:baculoviral IAP repeat-containing protein 7-like [Branchiostoma floridae]
MSESQHPLSYPSPSAHLPLVAIQRSPHQDMSTPRQQVCQPKHAEMADEQARIRSFKQWPLNVPVTPQALAKAGFFYTLVADRVRCFWCDGGLKDWEPGDEPWEEHARWYPRCEFLLQKKGDHYVQAVRIQQAAQSRLQGQQHIQHGLDSGWYLYKSALGQMHLYNSQLGVSLPLSSGKHQDRFEVLIQVEDQFMVVDVASVDFLKNPPSTASRRYVCYHVQEIVKYSKDSTSVTIYMLQF